MPGRFVFTPVRAGSAKLPRYEVTATANPSLILGAVLLALVPPATGPRESGAEASQIGGDPGGLFRGLERVANVLHRRRRARGLSATRSLPQWATIASGTCKCADCEGS